jgi:hypothetical protein
MARLLLSYSYAHAKHSSFYILMLKIGEIECTLQTINFCLSHRLFNYTDTKALVSFTLMEDYIWISNSVLWHICGIIVVFLLSHHRLLFSPGGNLHVD